MRFTSLTKLAGFLAIFSLASVAFARPVSCASGPETAAAMLRQMHADAYQVRDSADLLDAYNREPKLIDWRIQADTLQAMKDQINQMDQLLSQLRSMEGTLPEAEKTEIDSIAPAVVELTDTAQSAITYLNNNELLTWVPQYTAYASEMYNQARRIEHASATTTSSQLACRTVGQPMETASPMGGS